jgi:hypothetical protein
LQRGQLEDEGDLEGEYERNPLANVLQGWNCRDLGSGSRDIESSVYATKEWVNFLIGF